jgi:hypothetical protein
MQLSDGSLAISGGPKHYEIMIYKYKNSKLGFQECFEYANAINTNGAHVR